MAAIAAAVRFVARTFWVPLRVAGRLVLAPLTVLEKVFGGGGGGGGSEEAEAAGQVAEQTQQAHQAADRATTAGDHSANLRALARWRADGRDISPATWQRVPQPLEGYVRSLSLTECEVLGKQDIRTITDYLEGRIERVDGVRTLEEVARDLRAEREPSPLPAPSNLRPTAAGASSLQASINAAVARAKGTGTSDPDPVGIRL